MPETPVFQAYCGSEPPRFANPAELEYAKVLDWYGIPWQYEPTTFVLERDEEGRVTEAFSPDFYLPDQDLYLEVTVMKQSLVTRKNRKLRKLRALYPEVKCKLFYERRLRTARSPLRAAESVLSALAELDERIGEVFLGADEIRGRVREIGAELARNYEGSEPLLVGSLKSCIPFVCDLSRAVQIHHHLDFIELAGYGEDDDGIRFLKDLNAEIEGRDVVLVDAVIDTGLTMHYLVRSMAIRSPRSLRIASLFDRPYRRLVDDLPVGWVGFTIPDEFFVGYGFELDERYRNLPDLRLVH